MNGQNYYQQPGQAPYAQQPQYQQPTPPQYTYRQPPYDPTKEVLSVGAYIGMFILSSIPIVNIICWIVWLVSSNTNKNKKNYVIASIVLWVIGLVFSIIASVILAAAGVNLATYMT